MTNTSNNTIEIISDLPVGQPSAYVPTEIIIVDIPVSWKG
jgi:hypothetical protein